MCNMPFRVDRQKLLQRSGQRSGASYDWRVIHPRHLNCNREDLGKRWPTRRTYRQEPGTKETLAVRLRKRAIDDEKTLQGFAELAYQPSFQV